MSSVLSVRCAKRNFTILAQAFFARRTGMSTYNELDTEQNHSRRSNRPVGTQVDSQPAAHRFLHEGEPAAE
jgi:hypothetical protein